MTRAVAGRRVLSEGSGTVSAVSTRGRAAGAPTGRPGPGGTPPRLYACTPTRLTTWLDCPRRYRFAYLDRPSPPRGGPWAHNSVGASVHNALAGWWRLARGERTPARAGRLLESGWVGEGFRDEAQSREWRSRSREVVERYAATLDPDDEPLGVERTVGTTAAGMAVSGRIDRLDLRRGPRGEELVVVDYKTGRRPPAPEAARSSLALALYAVAAARALRRVCRRVQLHHLPTGEVLEHEHSEESLGRHVRRAGSIAAEAAAADAAHRAGEPAEEERFPPRPGPLCGWCDYARHCPEGRAVAPTRATWAGLG